jgi:hypothetical protein
MSEVLRTDILPEALTREQARTIVKSHLDSIIDSGVKLNTGIGTGPFDVARSKTPGDSKDVYEFCDLVRQAIENRQSLEKTTEEAKIILTSETADIEQVLEAITFSLERRQPGKFSEGAPFEGDVVNLKPIIREVAKDPDNPGYRKVVLGYWYDNLVRFTCWARTNKEANQRALWFEQLMQDYTWFYRLSGVSRVFFWDRGSDVEKATDTTSSLQSTTNKYYGRPIVYYVRTEKITALSEKELEQLIISVSLATK